MKDFTIRIQSDIFAIFEMSLHTGVREFNNEVSGIKVKSFTLLLSVVCYLPVRSSLRGFISD